MYLSDSGLKIYGVMLSVAAAGEFVLFSVNSWAMSMQLIDFR